jgi:uncharacterized membrane protein HdeD (DUF308 family)
MTGSGWSTARGSISLRRLVGLLIGIWLVAAGVVRLVRAIRLGQRVGLRAAVAVVEIAVGIAIVSNPRIGYATLAVLTGLWLIVNGVGTMSLALTIRALAPALRADPGVPRQSVG